MQTIKSIEELEKGKLIVVFSTKWCPDCIKLSQYIDLIVDKYQEEWQFIYVDSDQNLELSKHYNIMGIPSFVALKDGVKLSGFISKDSKSFDEICQWIESIEEA